MTNNAGSFLTPTSWLSELYFLGIAGAMLVILPAPAGAGLAAIAVFWLILKTPGLFPLVQQNVNYIIGTLNKLGGQ